MFYGIQLQAGESHDIQQVKGHDQFVLSRVVLIKGQNANVMLNGIIIAQLNQKTTQLNLQFRINPQQYQARIKNQGNGEIHLIGYYIQSGLIDEQIDNTISVATLLKQTNETKQNIQQINNKQQQKQIIQKKWDEYDWEDEEFLKRVK